MGVHGVSSLRAHQHDSTTGHQIPVISIAVLQMCKQLSLVVNDQNSKLAFAWVLSSAIQHTLEDV